jgi:hypothetical protein
VGEFGHHSHLCRASVSDSLGSHLYFALHAEKMVVEIAVVDGCSGGEETDFGNLGLDALFEQEIPSRPPGGGFLCADLQTTSSYSSGARLAACLCPSLVLLKLRAERPEN